MLIFCTSDTGSQWPWLTRCSGVPHNQHLLFQVPAKGRADRRLRRCPIRLQTVPKVNCLPELCARCASFLSRVGRFRHRSVPATHYEGTSI
jgi:hypothetical protein